MREKRYVVEPQIRERYDSIIDDLCRRGETDEPIAQIQTRSSQEQTPATNHSSTLAVSFDTCKNANRATSIAIPTQYIGTPFRVHLVKNLGNLLCSAMPYKVRLAQKT